MQHVVPKILEGLRENGAEDVLVVVGGTIPTEDATERNMSNFPTLPDRL